MRTSSPRAKIGLGDPIFSPDPALHSRDHLQLDQCPPYDRAFARLLPESPDGFVAASVVSVESAPVMGYNKRSLWMQEEHGGWI